MIKLEPQALDTMLQDAVATFPDECCGFFFGRQEGDDRLITDAQVVHNAKEGDKSRLYEVSARDYLRAEAYADERGLTLLGVYHSHPNHPALPSETDRLAAQPYFSYIIISVLEGRVDAIRSWQLNDHQQFEEETLSYTIQTI